MGSTSTRVRLEMHVHLYHHIPDACRLTHNLFPVEHAILYPRGAFLIIRHNETRDLTASVLTEVCHDVRVEPDLQPIIKSNKETLSATIANTSEGARLDIAMNEFWGKCC